MPLLEPLGLLLHLVLLPTDLTQPLLLLDAYIRLKCVSPTSVQRLELGLLSH